MSDRKKFIEELRTLLMEKEDVTIEKEIKDTVITSMEKEKIETAKHMVLKTVDGKELHLEEGKDVLEKGVLLLDEKGNPIAEGSYILEDKTLIKVNVEGKVEDIVKPEEVKDEVKKDEIKENKVEVKETNFEEQLTQLTDKVNKLISDNEKMSKKVIELSKQPGEKEVKLEKTGWQLNKEIHLNNTQKLYNSIAEFRNNNSKQLK